MELIGSERPDVPDVAPETPRVSYFAPASEQITRAYDSRRERAEESLSKRIRLVCSCPRLRLTRKFSR